ncbi:MAG: hypothetical protein L0Y35_09775 [Flammeovirgaceae bacterium]|nr:hypothetical protein [Flammeovirgaceae bacterium]
MTAFLNFFILLPIIGFVVSLLVASKREGVISWVVYLTVGIHVLGSQLFLIYWLLNGYPTLNLKDFVLIHTDHYEFFIDFTYDRITATYLFVGSMLTFLVAIYSRYYMHREQGYKRFFNTILFFYVGYNVTIFAGNLETLFIGWEMLGISSFLLIAFYRDRYLPVKNAVKVFSIYRIGDVGLILAMWMSHHLWHENITFVKLSNYELVHSQLQTHSLTGVFISLMILIAAAAKSAQLPFSSWLPRAMEGPTTSSAIFYGSLSVHIGAFIMLRTFPFWEHQISIRILIGLLGFVTSVIATGIARVQSSVKSQVAYASISQIGLIFIEIAAGLETIALIHFAGNAFLRTYQLLVSPSVVSYLIREQFYDFKPREYTVEDSLPKKIEYTIYTLCLKEWNLDSFMYRYFWNPLKWLGKQLDFTFMSRALYFLIPLYLVGLYGVYNRELVPSFVSEWLPIVFSTIGLAIVIKAFTERKLTFLSWTFLIMNHFWIALAVAFNQNFSFDEVHLYLSGIAISGILGLMCLYRIKALEGNIDLDRFHGHVYRHQKLAFLFFLACLGASGFPITPSFIGEDLIFSHIEENQYVLATSVALSFIINALAIIRIYARIYLGPHAKSMYEMAYRSS